jgi:hypothetical protein
MMVVLTMADGGGVTFACRNTALGEGHIGVVLQQSRGHEALHRRHGGGLVSSVLKFSNGCKL